MWRVSSIGKKISWPTYKSGWGNASSIGNKKSKWVWENTNPDINKSQNNSRNNSRNVSRGSVSASNNNRSWSNRNNKILMDPNTNRYYVDESQSRFWSGIDMWWSSFWDVRKRDNLLSGIRQQNLWQDAPNLPSANVDTWQQGQDDIIDWDALDGQGWMYDINRSPAWDQAMYDDIMAQWEEDADDKIQNLAQELDRAWNLRDQSVDDQTRDRDRFLEDQESLLERGLEDSDIQLERIKNKFNDDIADTEAKKEQVLEWRRRMGAVLGTNVTSWFYDFYNYTKKKYDDVINRLERDKDSYENQYAMNDARLNEDYNKMMDRAMIDWETNVKRINEEFEYDTRQFQETALININNLIEKHGFSSEKLWKKLQDLSLESMSQAFDIYTKYVDNKNSSTDNLIKQMEATQKARNQFLDEEDRIIGQYTENSLHRNVAQDVQSLLMDWEITESWAGQILSSAGEMIMNSLEDAWGPWSGTMFAQQIQDALLNGNTPAEIIGWLSNSQQFQEMKQRNSQWSGTQPKPFQYKSEDWRIFKFNPNTWETTPIDIGSVSPVPGKENVEYNVYDQGEIEQMALSWSEKHPVGQPGTRSGECGEFVNDYLKESGVVWSNIFGDRYEEDKLSRSNSETPELGSVAIMPIDDNWYWHVGIVEAINTDWTVTVRSSNYHNNDGKVTVDNIPLGKIDGYFVPSKATEEFKFDIKEFEKVNQSFIKAFSVAERNGSMLKDVGKSIDILQGEWFNKYLQSTISQLPWSKARELRNLLESVEGNVGMNELIEMKKSWATLWQVSEKQFDMLTKLRGNIDDVTTEQILDNLIDLEKSTQRYIDDQYYTVKAVMEWVPGYWESLLGENESLAEKFEDSIWSYSPSDRLDFSYRRDLWEWWTSWNTRTNSNSTAEMYNQNTWSSNTNELSLDDIQI